MKRFLLSLSLLGGVLCSSTFAATNKKVTTCNTPVYQTIEPMCKTYWTNYGSNFDSRKSSDTRPFISTNLGVNYAKVLRYFRYPQSAHGVFSYTKKGKTYEYDLAQYPFDWDNMRDEYNLYVYNYPQEQIEAAADLMTVCTAMIRPNNYDLSTGFVDSIAADALIYTRENLDLDDEMTYIQRNFMTLQDFEEQIYNALKVGPVLMNFTNDVKTEYQSYKSILPFVCDGYKDGKFHFNFCYTHSYAEMYKTGYYDMAELETQVIRTDYIDSSLDAGSYGLGALLYVRPKQAVSTTHYQMLCDDFAISSNGSALTVTSPIYSMTTVPFSGSLDLRFIKADGSDAAYAVGDKFSNVAFKESKDSYTVTMPTLADGSYTVIPAFTDANGTHHDVYCDNRGTQSYKITVTDGVATVTEDDIDITVTNFKYNPTFKDQSIANDLQLAAPYTVTATIKNNNPIDFNGYVAVALLDADSKDVLNISSPEQLTIPANSSRDITYIGSNLSRQRTNDCENLEYFDNYSIALASINYNVTGFGEYTRDSKLISEEIPVNVYAEPKDFVVKVSNLEMTQVNADKHNFTVSFDVTCTEGYFNNYLCAPLHQISSYHPVYYIMKSDLIHLELGEITRVTLNADFQNIDEDYDYFISILAGGVQFWGELTDGSIVNDICQSTWFGDNYYVNTDQVIYDGIDPDLNTGNITIRFKQFSNPGTDLQPFSGDTSLALDVAADEAAVVATELFTLHGARVNADNAAPGLYIKVETFADGSRRTSKIILK